MKKIYFASGINKEIRDLSISCLHGSNYKEITFYENIPGHWRVHIEADNLVHALRKTKEMVNKQF